MKLRIILFALTMILAGAAATAAQPDFTSYVDPFIGTAGEGFAIGCTYPGPQVPFGMVKPGPDTSVGDSVIAQYHSSGYRSRDSHIRGFSHTRMEGTGFPDYGAILLMPTTNPPDTLSEEKGYRSRFSHKMETAEPGYYSVVLTDTGIKVELTAGMYTAYHRYTFPAAATSTQVVINASHYIQGGKPVKTVVHTYDAKREITGMFHYNGSLSGRGGGIDTYFVIKSAKPFKTYGTWSDGAAIAPAHDAQGVTGGAVISFPESAGKAVELSVAISFISIEQAHLNMAHDNPKLTFDQHRQKARDLWREQLARLDVTGATDSEKRIFYSAAYRAMQMPTTMSEAGGAYVGLDKKVHKTKGFTYYSDFTLWDTMHTYHPLMTLVWPERQLDMIKSLISMYHTGGGFPRWPLASVEAGCMVGTPLDIVITDSYLKGISGFDIDDAYKGLVKTATTEFPPGSIVSGRGGITDYLKYGYLPAARRDSAASDTLEYAYSDYGLARLAEAIGKKSDAGVFLKRSKNYLNVWNPEKDFFMGRYSDGKFVERLNPVIWEKAYTEGDAWEWLWYVPHDVNGLISMMGGRDKFYAKLNEFFIKSRKERKGLMPAKYYSAGNETDLHAIYLFNWAGAPSRTQEEVSLARKKFYSDKEDGLYGNDDGGTLSSWYVFSALGIFPMPPNTYYVIGTPLFDSATIKFVGGKSFTIKKIASSPKDIYIKSATLNGKQFDRSYIFHKEITAGGTLTFTMSDKPENWGSGGIPDSAK